MKLPPAFLFPTTTILLDDDIDFLESLKRLLNNKEMIIKSFNNPINAKSYLELVNKMQKWQHNLFSIYPGENSFNSLNIEINFSEIVEQILNYNRFELVTTIVIDYQIPEFNIHQFLEEISIFPLKKILLTGIADADIAINLMEQGLINSYIKKHDINLVKKLTESINKHRISYFYELGSLINNSLTLINKNKEIKKTYYELIKSIFDTYDIKEYYLTDTNGSYNFINSNGQKLELIIKSKEQLDSEFEYLQDEITDLSTVARLKNNEIMLHTKGVKENQFLTSIPLDENKCVFYAFEKNINN